MCTQMMGQMEQARLNYKLVVDMVTWGRPFKGISGVKKEKNHWGFLWSKVFLDKGIANRTIGQSLRVHFPKSKANLYNQ